MADFAQAVSYVFDNEGGYVANPLDRGGPTNLGIVMATLSNFLGRPVTVDDIKALTRETAAPIYQRNYWRVVQGDAIQDQALATCIFDASVLTGPPKGVKMVQGILKLVPDGMLGPKSLAAINAADPKALVLAYADALEDWFIDIVLGDAKNTQKTFLDQWFHRSRKMRKMALR